jgi:hypothetical protein
MILRRIAEEPWRLAPSRIHEKVREVFAEREALISLLLSECYRRAPEVSERLRKRTPSLPWPEVENIDVPDQAMAVLSEFEALEPAKQTATARNVALLWDCFVEEFDGVSGFLAATATEQNEYLEKLEAAARRMEPGRYSAVGYHYVSVVLMMMYVGSLHGRESGRSAIALSRRVSMLIDEGRVIRAKESKGPILVVASDDGGSVPTSPEPRTQIPIAQAPPRTAPFRIGYVSQPAMRTSVSLRSN